MTPAPAPLALTVAEAPAAARGATELLRLVLDARAEAGLPVLATRAAGRGVPRALLPRLARAGMAFAAPPFAVFAFAVLAFGAFALTAFALAGLPPATPGLTDRALALVLPAPDTGAASADCIAPGSESAAHNTRILAHPTARNI